MLVVLFAPPCLEFRTGKTQLSHTLCGKPLSSRQLKTGFTSIEHLSHPSPPLSSPSPCLILPFPPPLSSSRHLLSPPNPSFPPPASTHFNLLSSPFLSPPHNLLPFILSPLLSSSFSSLPLPPHLTPLHTSPPPLTPLLSPPLTLSPSFSSSPSTFLPYSETSYDMSFLPSNLLCPYKFPLHHNSPSPTVTTQLPGRNGYSGGKVVFIDTEVWLYEDNGLMLCTIVQCNDSLPVMLFQYWVNIMCDL